MRYFLLLSLLASLLATPAPARAQGEICFLNVPNVSNCLGAAFSGYWSQNGGLAVFGYPIGDVQNGPPPGSDRDRSFQWLERARLEVHPENPPAYRILMGRMGAERLAQLGRDPNAIPRQSGPQPGCRWFAETGFNLCDQASGLGFKSYWERNGLAIPGLDAYQRSLALFGYPISAPQIETNADGATVLTQWFERARFEWHPNNPDQFKVLLGLLGRETRETAPAPRPAAAPPAPSLPPFGVEVTFNQGAAMAERIAALGPSWVRYNGAVWARIEAQPGQRNWNASAQLDRDLAAISAAGGIPILIVRSTPSWAQAVPGKQCGPIAPAALDEFATFLTDLVRRYSAPPYNVRYWELGNEPDAPYQVLGGGEGFGCWGDSSAADFGGAAYANMLATAYPAIKAVDPNAQVVFGGLLLDCDPALPNCAAGRFLDGVLRAGGGANFDILAYHAYFYWGPVGYDLDLREQKWQQRGGMTLGKLAFVREVLARYNLNKPIIMNEGGLLCFRSDPNCAPQGYEEDKAIYAARLYARARANGLIGAIWYTLDGPGWQNGGLLDGNQIPRRAYSTVGFLNGLLRDAGYVGPLTNGVIEGYEFASPTARYRIYWTNDGSEQTLPFPPNVRQVYTADGARLGNNLAALGVRKAPIVLEIAP